MHHQTIVKIVNGANEWAHRPYRLISAPYHCYLYKHSSKMKSNSPRTADRLPFVPGNSQITTFMVIPVVCVGYLVQTSIFNFTAYGSLDLRWAGNLYFSNVYFGFDIYISNDQGNAPGARHRQEYPENKVDGANMGPTWGRQDPGGPHAGPMTFAISDICPHGGRLSAYLISYIQVLFCLNNCWYQSADILASVAIWAVGAVILTCSNYVCVIHAGGILYWDG